MNMSALFPYNNAPFAQDAKLCFWTASPRAYQLLDWPR
jgi:hypothetical protein